MRKTWTSTLVWLIAVSAALLLAWVAPNETRVMGQLPLVTARTADRQAMALPQGLPAERTLALITFHGAQQPSIEGWIHGLRLKDDPAIVWVRMPVLSDPGDADKRSALETKLSRKYAADAERARLMPVFTDRDQFVRAAGLNGTDQVYAVVINRQGEVLARVEGGFDANKAQNLRETLLAQNF